MKIRPATVDDKFRLIEMGARFLLESDYGNLLQVGPAGVEAMIDGVLAGGIIFVAEKDVRVWDGDGEFQRSIEASTVLVGMIAMLVDHGNEFTPVVTASDVAWWVEPEHRGNPAIGPKLLWAAEAWAVQNGATLCKMMAPAGLAGSKIAEFYRRSGYHEVETAFAKALRPTS